MDDNLYDILNLDYNCTIEEIKKQYKRLALVYHPDKNDGNESRFKKITSAYHILSNAEKKTIYDSKVNLQQQFVSRPPNLRHPPKPTTVTVTLTNLDEFFDGCIKSYHYDRTVPCTPCNGTGIDDWMVNTVKCRDCQGQGTNTDIPFLSCLTCQGKGVYVLNNKRCKVCHGAQDFTVQQSNVVAVKPRTANKTRIEHTDSITVVVRHHFKTNAFWNVRFEKDALHVTVDVTLLELICGFTKTVYLCDDMKYVLTTKRMFDIHQVVTRTHHTKGAVVFRFHLVYDTKSIKICNQISNSLQQLTRNNGTNASPHSSDVTELEIVDI